MTKASDNEFPSLLFEEATAPSSPSAGTQRLFLDTSDGLLKLKDSSGTVTPVGGSVADITDIPTAETDTSLRLAPDGAGGVEWAAGGGGAFSPTVVGKTSLGGTATAFASAQNTIIVRPITFATDVLLLSVGFRVKMTSGAGTNGAMVCYTDAAGSPGTLVGQSENANEQVGHIGLSAATAYWMDRPMNLLLTAGDYWIGGGLFYQATSYSWFSDGSGSGGVITLTFSGYIPQGATDEGSYSGNSRDIDIRGLVVAL